MNTNCNKSELSAVRAKERKGLFYLKVGFFLHRHSFAIVLTLFIIFLFSCSVYADPLPADAGEALFLSVKELISKWIVRLGCVVMFVGAVMFGLGWRSDDAEGKSRGVSTLIAGGIVTTAAAAIGSFIS
jgi:hypothetical protein